MPASPSPEIIDFLTLKNILDKPSFSRPSKLDYEDTSWLLASYSYMMRGCEQECLLKLVQAYRAKEAMPSLDYNRAKFMTLHFMAEYDDM